MGFALTTLSLCSLAVTAVQDSADLQAARDDVSFERLEATRLRLRAGEQGLGPDWLRELRAADRSLQGESGEREFDVALAKTFCTCVADIERVPLGERPDDFRASDWYARAGLVAGRLGNPEMQFGMAWLGARAAVSEGRREDARVQLTEAMGAVSVPGLYRVRCALILSQLARYRGSFSAALDWVVEAEGTVGALPETAQYRDSAACEVSGASFELHIALGLLDQAVEDLTKEAEMAQKVGTPPSLARVALHQVDWLLVSKRYGLAASEAERMLEEGAVDRVRGVALQLELRRGIALAALGRQQPGQNEVALRSIETVLDGEGLQLADRLSARAWRFELLLRLGRVEEAREVRLEWQLDPEKKGGESDPTSLEDGAFLAALDTKLLLAGDPTKVELETQLAHHRRAYESFLEGWKSAPLREDGIAFLRYRNRTMVLSEYMRLILRTEEDEETGAVAALHALQQAQCMGTTARATNSKPLDLSTIRSTLTTGGGGVLVYAFGPDRSHVLTIDSSRIRAFEIGLDDRVATARENLVRTVREAPPDASEQKARGLRRKQLESLQVALAHEILPREVYAIVREWSSLNVIGGDHLGRMPFGLLRFPGEDTLGEQLAISSLKTLPQAHHLSKRAQALESSKDATLEEPPVLAFLGAPLPSESARKRWDQLGELPFGREHLDAMLRELGSPRTEIFMGERANRNALASARLSQARLLWILAHGVSAPEFGSGSALVLSPANSGDDGFLSSTDLLGHSVPALVLVSACGAGRGPKRMGDDRSADFGGALLAAGASCVVLSDSELELKAQVELMQTLFETCVQGGSTPSAALRDWRRALAEDNLRSDPYYSQAYVEGLGNSPIPARGK